MKSQNYASEIAADDVANILTPFRLINFSITLTADGLKNVKKVIALFFEYMRKLQEEWLAKDEILDVWQEQKTVSNLQYDVYNVRPAEEHVPEIS